MEQEIVAKNRSYFSRTYSGLHFAIEESDLDLGRVVNDLSLVGHTSEIREYAIQNEIRTRVFPSATSAGLPGAVRVVRGIIDNALGTVHLRLDPATLLKDKFIYWIDVEYRIGSPLARFIVSDNEIEARKERQIDPSYFGFPLYESPSGRWFARQELGYEFLIPDALPFYLFKHVQFNQHNKVFCWRYGDDCTQSDMDRSVCELIALALARPELTGFRTLLRTSTFFIGPELLVPFALVMRDIRRNEPTLSKTVPDNKLDELFAEIGMGNWNHATTILRVADRNQVNDYLLRGVEKLFMRSIKSEELYLK